MADELSIQQTKQTSATPYVLGTGLVGGLGTAYAVNRYTKPAYSSYEDLVNEKEDTFNGKLQSAKDEQKTLLEKAKSARVAAEKAGAQYDRDLAAYQEANKFELKETPEYQQLVKKQNEIEQALADRRTAEAEKLKGKKVNTLFDYNKIPEYVNEATQKRERDLKAKVETFINRKYELLEKVEEAKNAGNKELVKSLNNEVVALDKEIEAYLDKEVTSWYVAEGKKVKNNVKNQINQTKKAIAQNINTAVEERSLNNLKESSIADGYAKLVQRVRLNAGDAYADAITKFNGNQFNSVDKVLNKKISVNKANIDKLVELQIKYEEAMAKGSGTEAEQIVKQFKLLWGLINKTETIKPGEAPVVPFIETLSEADKKLVQKMLGDNAINSEELTKVINNLEKQNVEISKLLEDVAKYKTSIEEIGGKGAYVENGILFHSNGKKVDFTPNTSLFLGRNKINVPEYRAADIIAELKANGTTEMTSEQIEAEVNRILAQDIQNVEQGAARVKAAREALPKGEARAIEDITKEFAEKNGSREDAVKKAVEKSKDEIKSLFEKKWGNGKIAAAIAGGAAVAGLLGYMIAPKNKA